MNPSRFKYINTKHNDVSKKILLYWMQQSMRVEFNHALDYAIKMANLFKIPLVVFFIIRENYLGANLRHYKFMIEGLIEVDESLRKQGIKFVVFKNESEAYSLIKEAHTLVMDYGYLKTQINWIKSILDFIDYSMLKINVAIIETDSIVPVKQAYFKGAYGAYVIRPHLMKKLTEFMDYSSPPKYLIKQEANLEAFNYVNISLDILKNLKTDLDVKPYYKFKGGHSEAINHLINFFNNKVNDYSRRSDPSLQIQSYQSIYLHFGNISPLEIMNIATKYYNNNLVKKEDYDSFIEQLLVRRELSFNFVTYEKDYDDFDYMTEEWAYITMNNHIEDKREYIYTADEIEFSKTHDIYFNACMYEARLTGFMANYMRMYWAKKIIEWSITYKNAYELIVYLNNKYLLDGRDANTYTNIAWCFGKMDRPWMERPIFGKLRYMNDLGLKRKFDMDKYVQLINSLKKE